MTASIQGHPVDPTPLIAGQGYVYDGTKLVPTAIGGGGGLKMLGYNKITTPTLASGIPGASLFTPIANQSGTLLLAVISGDLQATANPTYITFRVDAPSPYNILLGTVRTTSIAYFNLIFPVIGIAAGDTAYPITFTTTLGDVMLAADRPLFVALFETEIP